MSPFPDRPAPEPAMLHDVDTPEGRGRLSTGPGGPSTLA